MNQFLALSALFFIMVLRDSDAAKLEPFVYAYSKVVQDGSGPPINKMLTIVTGEDGKYHYVKSEGKSVEKGVWKGSLPQLPKIDPLITQKISETGVDLAAVDALVSSFDSSIANYMKSLATL